MYWPDAREGPGHSEVYEPSGIKVSVVNTESKGCIVLTQLSMEWKGETRRLAHVHFTAWPDHGVPEGTKDIVTLVDFIRRHRQQNKQDGPMVMHCSAGVGRTGVVMGIDICLDQVWFWLVG